MRILITGGAGFIAYHLACRLQEEKHEVYLLDNFNSFYDPAIKRKNVRDLQLQGSAGHFEIDILDIAGLRRVFQEVRPEGIVHLAAWAGVRPSMENPRIYSDVNVTGTVNMLELAKEFAVGRFIFGSSSSVYGGSERVPFAEDDPVDSPVSPYAATKRAGELLCHTFARNYGMHITCLRFFTVYGPRQRPEMAIHLFARLIQEGKEIPVFGNGQSRRDYTYVEDIIAGIVAALRVNPAFEIINLGESRTTTLLELISLLETAMGKKARRLYCPSQAGDMQITYANIDRARRILDYQPTTSIETGIRKFVEWYMQPR